MAKKDNKKKERMKYLMNKVEKKVVKEVKKKCRTRYMMNEQQKKNKRMQRRK